MASFSHCANPRVAAVLAAVLSVVGCRIPLADGNAVPMPHWAGVQRLVTGPAGPCRRRKPTPQVLLGLRGGGGVLPAVAGLRPVSQQTMFARGGGRGLTVSTFNILCPLFRRVPTGVPGAASETTATTEGGAHVVRPQADMGRESEDVSMYGPRQEEILALLWQLDSDVVCLQEFWVGNDALVSAFRAKLDARYQWFALARTHGRGDGLVVLVRHTPFVVSVVDRQDIFFRDIGDRVAMVLRLDCSATPGGGGEVLLVNTHLVFPHERYFDVIRMRELRKILGFLELYRLVVDVQSPLILCGDFNGGPSGMQYRHLRSLNFTASSSDDTTWVTHKTHRGDLVCCDFVWFLNPSSQLGRLEANWHDMVFRSTCQRVTSSGNLQAPGPLASATPPPAPHSLARRPSAQNLAVRWLQLPGERCETARGDPGGASQGYDDTSQEWKMTPEEFRRQMDRLGFVDANDELTDGDIAKLLEGPDRMFVRSDRLLEAGDVFRLFDADKDDELSLQEFTSVCRMLDMRSCPLLPAVEAPAALFATLSALSGTGGAGGAGGAGRVKFAAFRDWWESHLASCSSADGTPGMPPSAQAAGASRPGSACPTPRDGGRRPKGAWELHLEGSSLFPTKLQSGVWDQDFALSDHGLVNCRFSWTWVPGSRGGHRNTCAERGQRGGPNIGPVVRPDVEAHGGCGGASPLPAKE